MILAKDRMRAIFTLALTVSLILTTPAQSQSKSLEIEAVFQKAAQAWMTGDADGFASLFTPDGEFIAPGNRWVGYDAIRQITADFSASHSNVKIEIKRIIIDGDEAVAEWRWEDTQTATNVRTIADDAIVVDFKQGLVSRWREYIDTISKG